MRIAVTGSIATDHLMTFPGQFSDAIVSDQLDALSVSFLVTDLQIRRGGVAANIGFGLGMLGLSPIVVAAVGADFAEYRAWLERHGVDCSGVHTSEFHHTARFMCTTDQRNSQIASFYPGAMAEAREIELAPLAPSGFDLVVIGANDPVAMTRHVKECQDRGYPMAADPSQQLSFLDGELIRSLVEGAAYLFSNEYEAHLIEQKTGWVAHEVVAAVGTRVTTLGAQGVRIEQLNHPTIEVPAIPDVVVADPTGAGDAFRAGFFAGLAWDLDVTMSARLGATMASFAIEAVGPQEYTLNSTDLLDRMTLAYGDHAAQAVRPYLGSLRD
ncbi:MAG: carbohydrate kinase family protein [Actinomycetota bacterium]